MQEEGFVSLVDVQAATGDLSMEDASFDCNTCVTSSCQSCDNSCQKDGYEPYESAEAGR